MGNRTNWLAGQDPETRRKLAAGRTRYNKRRQLRAIFRRSLVAEGIRVHGFGRGAAAAIARELHVSRWTVARDMKIIIGTANLVCPLCQGYVPKNRRLEVLEQMGGFK
jgi:DNA invertase Pin-like site-specific DNA recombinase